MTQVGSIVDDGAWGEIWGKGKKNCHAITFVGVGVITNVLETQVGGGWMDGWMDDTHEAVNQPFQF